MMHSGDTGFTGFLVQSCTHVHVIACVVSVFTMSICVFSGLSGFLPSPKNMLIDEVYTLCVCVCWGVGVRAVSHTEMAAFSNPENWCYYNTTLAYL